MEFFAIVIFFVVIAVGFRWNNSRKTKRRAAVEVFRKDIDHQKNISKVNLEPRKRRRRSKEEILADEEACLKRMIDDSRKAARDVQTQAERVGAKSYIWHGHDCCPHCNKQNGKRFYWAKPPKTGHPGEGRLCPNGYCRCWAEVIVTSPKK